MLEFGTKKSLYNRDPEDPYSVSEYEFNSVFEELKNLVLVAGLTLSPATAADTDPTKLQQLFAKIPSLQWENVGTANARILEPLPTGLKVPQDYSAYDGAVFQHHFVENGDDPTIANWTIELRQQGGTGLGAKNVVKNDGSPMTNGWIADNTMFWFRYEAALDGGAGGFRVERSRN